MNIAEWAQGDATSLNLKIGTSAIRQDQHALGTDREVREARHDSYSERYILGERCNG